METKAFYQLLEKPSHLSDTQREELQKLMQEYPFFSTPFSLSILDLIRKKDPSVYQELKVHSLLLQNKKRIFTELEQAAISLEPEKKEEESSHESRGPVRVELPGDKIEKKDFTKEILDEITIIGKGVKATPMESFEEKKPDPETEKKLQNTPIVTKTTEAIADKEKQGPSDEKSDIKPGAESKPQIKDESTDTPANTQNEGPKSVADEVMENLRRMRAEREANIERLHKAEDAVDRHIHPAEEKKAKKTTEKTSKDTSKSAKTTKDGNKEEAASKPEKKSKDESIASKKSDHSDIKSGKKKNAPDSNLIESFINSDVRIKPKAKPEDDQNKEDLSKPSTKLPSNLISENLANIFEKQGKSAKAIAIYKQLILKYPEKKSYFAQKINNLEEK